MRRVYSCENKRTFFVVQKRLKMENVKQKQEKGENVGVTKIILEVVT
jgi:hypothetical protein